MSRQTAVLATAYGLARSAQAMLWRRLMFRTTFVAVCGSVGKTTATRCLEAMPASRYRTNATDRGNNSRLGLASTVLRTRYSHRYTVIEVGAKLPGSPWRASRMVPLTW